MRKDLSLIRRLEKIEKELGYCQIKLEKEHRLLRVFTFSAHTGIRCVKLLPVTLKPILTRTILWVALPSLRYLGV